MFAWRDVFPMCTLVFSSIFALSWAIALFDLSYRFLTCHYCFNSVADDDLIADDEHDPQGIVYCVDGYRELESELAVVEDIASLLLLAAWLAYGNSEMVHRAV